jgi:hypothetical protein
MESYLKKTGPFPALPAHLHLRREEDMKSHRPENDRL